MKKYIWLAVVIIAGYAGYRFLFAPIPVTFTSYKKIQQGMSRAQIQSVLRAGILSVQFKDMSNSLQLKLSRTDREELEDEHITDLGHAKRAKSSASQDLERMERGGKTINRYRDAGGVTEIFDTVSRSTIQVKGASMYGTRTGDTPRPFQGSTLMNCEITSEDGSIKADGKFVPAKHATVTLMESASGVNYSTATRDTSSSGDYEYADYEVALDVNQKKFKLIRSGVMHFDNGTPDTQFEIWRGKDDRVLAIKFVNDRTSYWSYQGPVSDFPANQAEHQVQQKQSVPNQDVATTAAPPSFSETVTMSPQPVTASSPASNTTVETPKITVPACYTNPPMASATPAAPTPHSLSEPIRSKAITMEELNRLGKINELVIDGVSYQDVRWNRITGEKVAFFHKSGVITLPVAKVMTALKDRLNAQPVQAAATESNKTP